MRPGLDAIDAVDSILPAGTLSGAPKIRPARSSMSWKIISGASMEEPLVIWISPETWIPVLRFALHIRKMARYLSEAVQASWLTACHRKNIRSVSTRQRQ